ncbi:response regulator [Mobilitalea sibirica]|uniref:Stage 0 sporulation protein A homolog n=1 Tax=Mobilitalea sibirica TaxID=1462919 RepID=A0A8J7L1Y5_9FIRM|nr:response regulator [Mobilitalea sibirica]MBH1939578.1 response regulator [Mobilitalea sibirica]
MKILIVEDDLPSRLFLSKLLLRYGSCDVAVDGLDALDAVLLSLEQNKPYQLICLDIMMPKIDGLSLLKSIRDMEEQYQIPQEQKAKIIMTTAMSEVEHVQVAFDIGCDAYAAKPLDTTGLIEALKNLRIIEPDNRS